MAINNFELWFYNKKTNCSTLVTVTDRQSSAFIWCKGNLHDSDVIYYIVEVAK